jgi:3-hydroxybutyrate dehydrogenase
VTGVNPMDVTAVTANSFAMPFVSPSYPRDPYRFASREHLIVTYRTDPVTLRGAWTGPAALELRLHASAPLTDLPVLEVISGVHLIADLKLVLAKLSTITSPFEPLPTESFIMNSFQDKVALITGAASGIGKEIAHAFAREGAKVAIADMRKEAAEAAAADIIAAGGIAMGVAMDVSDEAAVNAGVDSVHSAYGRIDILVSNAGIQIVHPIESFPFAEWKKMLAVHLDDAFLTTKACLKHMYATNSGSVVYIGSVHSKEASPLKAAYVTAKHGILGLSRVVAKEGAKHNVRSNVVCPGFVRTPLVDKQIPEQAKELGISEADVVKNVMLKETVDGEFTTVEDVAAAVLYFAGAKTKALTGQSLVVSHGWFME